MSMYVPEIKEEVSENAKMLVVEEDGKVYRTEMPKGNKPVFIYLGDSGYTADEELFNLSPLELCDVILNHHNQKYDKVTTINFELFEELKIVRLGFHDSFTLTVDFNNKTVYYED